MIFDTWRTPFARCWCPCIAFVLVACMGTNPVRAADYLIGTYYFPGWTDGAKGLEFPAPWQPIKRFPERKPLLGWYSDSSVAVLKQQAAWMNAYGIDFVVFDWYWNGSSAYLDHAVAAFKQIKRPRDVLYSLLWANHYRFPGGMPQYRAMVANWIQEHFSDPGYLRIDGRPVVFIFGIDGVADAAKTIGVSPAELIRIANAMSAQAGFPAIYFVGGTPALSYWVNDVAPQAGFSALSAYNYHNGFSGTAESATPPAEGYPQFDEAYRTNWKWIARNSLLPYILPMTSGWDKRPWGGSKNPKRDHSISTPEEFEIHLRAARSMMDAMPDKVPRVGVVCCWNEFGEGSYIEPTERDGFAYLERIRRVFGTGQR